MGGLAQDVRLRTGIHPQNAFPYWPSLVTGELWAKRWMNGEWILTYTGLVCSHWLKRSMEELMGAGVCNVAQPEDKLNLDMRNWYYCTIGPGNRFSFPCGSIQSSIIFFCSGSAILLFCLSFMNNDIYYARSKHFLSSLLFLKALPLPCAKGVAANVWADLYF